MRTALLVGGRTVCARGPASSSLGGVGFIGDRASSLAIALLKTGPAVLHWMHGLLHIVLMLLISRMTVFTKVSSRAKNSSHDYSALTVSRLQGLQRHLQL